MELIHFEAPNLIYWAIPAFLMLLIAEAIISAIDQRDLFEAKDTFASLTMGVGNVITNLVAKAIVLSVFWFVYEQAGIFKEMLRPDVAWVWVALFFAEDFSYYWFHRVSHESRFFWASHVVHHSSQRYNLSTALRQTWTGNLSGSFVFWIWLPLIGFHPVMVIAMQSISLIYQFWIHTETIGKLPWPLEFIFNTPSHHRVHHGSDIKYLDRNHAGILIIWDRMFGTFQEEEERPTYGLTANIDTYNPFRIAFHEWADLWCDFRQPLPLKDRLGYLFGPPGWSHDGSRKTTKSLRAEIAAREDLMMEKAASTAEAAEISGTR